MVLLQLDSLSRAKFNLGKIDEAFDLMEFCINHFKKFVNILNRNFNLL